MKILIPSCKSNDDLLVMLGRILDTTSGIEVVMSCQKASASVNRNRCLDYVVDGEVAIMLDDDIEGFYPGWLEDLVNPFHDPAVIMVSARLLNADGSFAQTCSRCYEPEPEEIEIKSNGVCVLPTAAIAFRHRRGHQFDENFLGSGFEDNDWCHQYLAADPTAKFIQSNRCRLIHRNEMKQQHGRNWKHNQAYFWHKWGVQRVS